MRIDLSRRQVLHAAGFALLAPTLGHARALAAAADVVPEPPSGFDSATTAEAATRGLDLAGRTALVTGATSGIGMETMRVLALRGAHVIATARSRDKAEAARRGMRGRITPVVLDLADFDSVRACAAQVRALSPKLDALVCNAGIVLDRLEQVRGLEKQFVVNHLGHFLLVNELLAQVRAAAQGRVVVLGSGDHERAPTGGIQFDDLSGAGWNARYSHSKLANGLFSLELARRLRGTSATANCVTPGHTRTNILRDVGNAYRDSARTVQVGAATPCYAAVHPAIAGVSGTYLRDFRAAAQGAHQRDAAMARRLWDVSAALTRKT
ncbi:SDR family NAD(P)-dependent oxidoreductase [Luteimonas sp. MC1825]|uniref:SDR family NAD(P)-dependent oxidoreductase n=1 Tax=Luteimonas sp. MC1825 TaxID=2761107 RepID=UPI0016082205|nr:SDR family NAD(P)-dependent oxidoreductase [Luteimonas sp. MC1825]MBB6599515.1 SDR family NAD(P)-dependent oxidoreductase [Luteimonas sp. MC1825]QOC87213.1 SDR family NAD(P)-dependent oxidoreductase [Luteimonas sp. MC1825]